MLIVMTRLETRHIETFLMVVDEGSFIGAADLLGISQAAVSQHIAALERTLGSVLFHRQGGPKPVTLTPAGRVLIPHAQAMLERMQVAQRDLDDLASGMRGRLVCGTFQSVSVQLLPDIVARVRTETPDLAIRLEEQDENEILIDQLIDGKLDVAFLAGPINDSRIDVIELGRDPFLVLLPKNHEFDLDPKAKAFPSALLSNAPMVGQYPRALQQVIDDGLRPFGITLNYVFRTNDNGAVQAMVRAGMGPAVMPRLAIDESDKDIIIMPMDPPIEPRPIYIAQNTSQYGIPAADRFVQLAREISTPRLLPPLS
jgi:DNA-binding transcriptional LysR family regulator